MRTSRRLWVVLAALLPTSVLLVYSYVLIPLDLGRGLLGGYSALWPMPFQIGVAAVWLAIVASTTVILAKFDSSRKATSWSVVRRAVGAFCIAATSGFALAAVPMGARLDALGYYGVNVGSEVSGVLFLPLLYAFLGSAAAGVVLIVVATVEAVASRASASRGRP